jgi:hypothetical protein
MATTMEEKLHLPKSVHLRNQGTTGAQFQNMPGPGEEHVRRIIIENSLRMIPGTNIPYYGTYQPEIWDCEDHCFLAAADVRRAQNRQPIGIAIGTLGNEDHAVNCIWHQGNDNKWRYWFYDPTKDSNNRRDINQEFKTKVIIPLPVGSSRNRDDYHPVPPYENKIAFPFLEDAAFLLDKKDSYNFGLIPAAKAKLTEWFQTNYPGPGGHIDPNYYQINDNAFYWFAHIHKEFLGAPIGVAFGERDGDKAYGALILWETKEEYTYWDIDNAEEFGDDVFKPRVVIA